MHSHQYSITKENRKKYKGNGNEDLVGHLYPRVVLFHDIIVKVKSTIFKLKTININIYFLKLFYNLNFKSIFNQTH